MKLFIHSGLKLNHVSIWGPWFWNRKFPEEFDCVEKTVPCFPRGRTLTNGVISLSITTDKISMTGVDLPVSSHDDVIKWKHFLRYWPFTRGIHRSPVNSPHKGQWRGALTVSLIWAWTNGWANHRDAGDLKSHRAHYNVTVICMLYRNPHAA